MMVGGGPCAPIADARLVARMASDAGVDRDCADKRIQLGVLAAVDGHPVVPDDTVTREPAPERHEQAGGEIPYDRAPAALAVGWPQ